MACGDPSFMSQMQVNICQLCGRDVQSGCGREQTVNYQKQVDPPAAPYSQIIPDSRYDEDLRDERRRKGKDCDAKKAAPLQVCIPIPVVPGQTADHSSANTSTQKADNNTVKNKDKDKDVDKEKESETSPPEKSPVIKATCLPGGGSCPPPVKMLLCLPCTPPENIPSSSNSGGSSTCAKAKPKDYTYRCESRELRGGNLYSCCQCVKRNGLQHDCPRTPCQGRPACLTKPWPDCWASGGCHGIDYTREKGVKRYDPCREQRFDKKECKGPDSGASNQSSCGGNMMVVVCPKITNPK